HHPKFVLGEPTDAPEPERFHLGFGSGLRSGLPSDHVARRIDPGCLWRGLPEIMPVRRAINFSLVLLIIVRVGHEAIASPRGTNEPDGLPDQKGGSVLGNVWMDHETREGENSPPVAPRPKTFAPKRLIAKEKRRF